MASRTGLGSGIVKSLRTGARASCVDTFFLEKIMILFIKIMIFSKKLGLNEKFYFCPKNVFATLLSDG